MGYTKKSVALLFLLIFFSLPIHAQRVSGEKIKLVSIGDGWTNNSVNAVIFRRNSLVTHANVQYSAYYDPDQFLVLAKRKSGSKKWKVQRTSYKGNASDAHNTISIMVDGNGYFHVAWDHHGHPLKYAKSVAPGSLELGETVHMTNSKEDNVTYPEFYKMPDGNLLFFYRNGASGNGELVINKYDTKRQSWKQLHHNLLDGEGKRNAYWQGWIDDKGTIHLSWVWRESWDVANNHDICYARSRDGGETWQNSKGEKYDLPINASSSEIAFPVPVKSELINQTSMTADKEGNPLIATYWREKDSQAPQFHVVYHNGNTWVKYTISNRQTPFSLSGGGTKRIPISRPQVMIREKDGREQALVIFRDEERGNKVSVAYNNEFPTGKWNTIDLYEGSVGAWEPSFDTELWKGKGLLNIFVQKVDQVDGEGLANVGPEKVNVLEWDPQLKQKPEGKYFTEK